MVSAPVPLMVDELAGLRERRSAKWRTYPADVIPLTISEMDFPIAEPIAQVLLDAIRRSDTGYPMAAPELGEALASFTRARWDWPVEPGDVTALTNVSSGCVELLRACCRPGDAVVINPPVYPPFFDWVTEVGAELVEAPLCQDGSGRWRLDLDALREAFRRRPAAYILCSPHNPVGRVHEREELAVVVQLAHEYGVRVISNEIHAPLVLDGAAFTPFLTMPGAAEIGVSLLSASKAWNVAGLMCAAVVAESPAMRTLIDRLPPDGRWRVGHLGVLAALAAFGTAGRAWLDALLVTLDMRRGQLGDLIATRLPDVRWVPPQATCLAWLDCRRIGSGDQPRDLFLERGRVALEPGPNVGTPGSGYVRLNFGTSEEVLDEAVARMASALDR
jgi:cysteine-S-conjugate beta-lyase